MDYAKLKADLVTENMTGLTAVTAAALNARSLASIMPIREARRWLLVADKLTAIRAAAQGTIGQPAWMAATTLLGALELFDHLDLGDTQGRAAITAARDLCVAANLLVAADKTALLALGDNRRSLREKLGYTEEITPRHIIKARAP
jgi:hypothetical protein